jgi:hypothetical protein
MRLKTTTRMSISVSIVMTFLLGSLLPMFPLAAALNDPADTHAVVHVTGDWIVQDTRAYTAGTVIVMDSGSIVVQNGGVLTLDASSIIFQPSAHGNRGLTVEKGGTFKMANGGGMNSGTVNTYHCAFLKGSTIDIKDTQIWSMGGSTPNSPDTGIYVGGDNATIHGTLFRDNRQTTPLLQINGKNANIDNSTFGVFANRGIVVEGQANISDCVIAPLPGTATAGITVQNGGNVTLIHNNIGNVNTGVSVMQSQALLIKNTIHDNSQNGIFALYDAKLELRGNTIEKNQMDGIFAGFDAQITVQKDNLIRNNLQTGINAYSGGTFIIKGSIIRDNTDVNVQVYNSKVTMEECTIIGPMSGISVAGSRPVSIKNTTFDNAMGSNPIIVGDLNSDITVEGSHFSNGDLAIYEINEANIVSKKNDFTNVGTIVFLELHSNYKGYSNTYTGPDMIGFAQMRSTIYCENDKYTGPGAPTSVFLVSSDAVVEIHNVIVNHVDNSVLMNVMFGGKAFIYDSKINFVGTAVLFASDSTITSINSTIALSDVRAVGKGKINLGWHSTIKTQWQNGIAAPGAQVDIVDAPANLTDTITTGTDGSHDTDIIQWTSTEKGDINHNNYNITASLNGMSGTRNLNISKNMVGPLSIVITIQDTKAPWLNITSPKEGDILNITDLTVSGNFSDQGSGIGGVILQAVPGVAVGAGKTSYSGFIFTVQNIPEGKYHFFVNVTDISGNLATAQVNVTIDRTAPTIIITEPTRLYSQKNTFYLNGTTEIGANVTVNGTAVANINGDFGAQLTLPDGEHRIEVTATDAAGNKAITTKTVIVDTVAPTLTINVANGTWTDSTKFVVSGTTDGAIMKFKQVIGEVNSSMDVIQKTWSFNLTLVEGANKILFTSTDLAGLSTTKELVINVDTIAPVIEITSPKGPYPVYTNQLNQTITGKVTEKNLKSLTVNGKSVSVVNGTFITDLTLAVGQNHVNFTAQDMASTDSFFDVFFDIWVTPPTIVVISPVSGFVTKYGTVAVEVIVTSQDPAPNVTLQRIRMRNDQPVRYAGNATLGIGQNILRVNATDRYGNTATATRTVVYDNDVSLVLTKPSKIKMTTTKDTVTISGTTDPGATIYINTVAIPVGADGSFSYKLVLKEGKNTIDVKAVDPVGNQRFYTPMLVTYKDARQFDINMLIGLGIVLMILGLIIGIVVGKVISKPKTPKPVEEYPEVPTKTEETPFEPAEEPEEPKPAPKEQPKPAPKEQPKPEPKEQPKPGPKTEKIDSSLDSMLKDLEK